MPKVIMYSTGGDMKYRDPYEDEEEEFEELDTRFLEVCIDGDVEDLVQLFEEISRSGEILSSDDLNCADNSGRVSQ